MSPQFDPKLGLLETLAADLPSLSALHLQAAALRTRFTQHLPWQPEPHLEHRLPARRTQPATPAAVLIPLVVRENGVHVLLTQRAAHLHDHAGQISFPGGRSEPADSSTHDTALRETAEEIGLHRRHIELLGTLPEYGTATGYRVTPVIGLVHPPFVLQVDSFEVASVFEVPLDFLMNPAMHQLRRVDLPPEQGGTRYYFAMSWQAPDNTEYFIWGATAGMLRNLYHYLRAAC